MMSNPSSPHISVLLSEILQFFEEQTLNTFVDGTLGGGGHTQAILERHPEIKRYVGIDQDPEALSIAKKRLAAWSDKLILVHGNFGKLKAHLTSHGISQVQGMILDLGVSSMQLDQAEKGFSFMRDGPLDMRMNPENSLTAADIINTYSESELGRIFRDYGEEKQWRAAAKTIVSERDKQPIQTTNQLVEILRPSFSWKKKGVNPLTLIFQALRICVNSELQVLEKVIPEAIELLAPGGRLGVISFHSLEDRIVKNAFRHAASDKFDNSGIGGLFLDKDPIVKILTKKPVYPQEEEIKNNPRSRSAKLRFIQKL